MATQKTEASSAPSRDSLSVDLDLLANPLDYIKKAVSYFRENEKEVHNSCCGSVYFRPLPREDEAEAAPDSKDAQRVQGEPKMSKFKAFKEKFKCYVRRKKTTRVSEDRKTSIASVVMDAAFEPLTEAMDRLQNLHKKIKSNMSELEEALRISTAEENLQKSEKEVIEDIDGKKTIHSIFLQFIDARLLL